LQVGQSRKVFGLLLPGNVRVFADRPGRGTRRVEQDRVERLRIPGRCIRANDLSFELQTFEILLLIMIAPSVASASRFRPTITGAPGKALRVNIAAKDVVGSSRAMNVCVIFAGFGASVGMNSKRVQPTRNPAGSAA
jgi:hypothetical protein